MKGFPPLLAMYFSLFLRHKEVPYLKDLEIILNSLKHTLTHIVNLQTWFSIDQNQKSQRKL